MPDTVLPKPQPQAFDNLMRAQAQALRAKDEPPKTRAEWQKRRPALRTAMFAAMGPFPDKPCALDARAAGTLKRSGYRIEKILFQSRPDLWVTSHLYLPEPAKGNYPAILVVHGHWAGARRDPVVQARCLGLVKLGFVVLAVDAFGAGERYTTPAMGTYHGALYGSTLWPTGLTLLGIQVYDNQRAIDYLRTRAEVDRDRLGITGASGGGNQTMYAGALDDRLQAVVPVCSVGTYQAYLHAACCVCEVLPGALTFCEEGDVLGLVAPRALLVINATRDAFQFSVEQANRSIARARPIFDLEKAGDKLRHITFESPHAYNQPMREAMYGWMTRWLKNEGDGKPIPEPKHEIEKPEDLACLVEGKRPKAFVYPPSLAYREGQLVLARPENRAPDHEQAWESTAMDKRNQLRRQIFGDFPVLPERRTARPGKLTTDGGIATMPAVVYPEPNMPVPLVMRWRTVRRDIHPACVLLHLDGKAAALEHPLAAVLLERGWMVVAADLRATGETRPQNDAIRDAPDHNSAEHALWRGRPLLGQWVFDVRCVMDYLAGWKEVDRDRIAVVGLGQAGTVALCTAGLFAEHVSAVGTLSAPVSYLTDEAYPAGTRMGLLAPGILRVGDIPHLAALFAPRRLVIAEGLDARGKPLAAKGLAEAFRFTRSIYRLHRIVEQFPSLFTLTATARAVDVAAALAPA